MMTIRGELSIGNYMAYAGLLIWIIYPLRGLGRFIVDMSSGLVSYDRVMKIIKEDREALDDGNHNPREGVRGEFVFDNVSFEYEEKDKVLHEITFSIKAGQKVALLGSTGSGKT